MWTVVPHVGKAVATDFPSEYLKKTEFAVYYGGFGNAEYTEEYIGICAVLKKTIPKAVKIRKGFLMFELDVEREFSAAHSLRGYNGQCCEKHGHNWGVQVFVRAEKLDAIGISVDFKALKRELDAILLELDHKDLNQVPPFDTINPTSENIAKTIFDRLAGKLDTDTVHIHRVRVNENRSSGATYFREEEK